MTGMGWPAMPLTWRFVAGHPANWTFFGTLRAQTCVSSLPCRTAQIGFIADPWIHRTRPVGGAGGSLAAT